MGADLEGWEDLNVILSGDFHQFPPVALHRKETLYVPTELDDTVIQRHVGRHIYEAFETMVLLKEQKRVHDEVWYQFLRRLRNGNVTQKDIAMLRSLVLSPSNTINFDEAPWRDAFLITPRHAVRIEWNKKAVQKALSGEEQIHLRNSRSSKGRKRLADEIEIAIGMKVLVTYNRCHS